MAEKGPLLGTAMPLGLAYCTGALCVLAKVFVHPPPSQRLRWDPKGRRETFIADRQAVETDRREQRREAQEQMGGTRAALEVEHGESKPGTRTRGESKASAHIEFQCLLACSSN